LGNHYIAFTIPSRTFIITLDRVKNGIQAARKAKGIADTEKQQGWVRNKFSSLGRSAALSAISPLPFSRHRSQKVAATSFSSQQPKGFLSRFVDGYIQAEREAEEKDAEAEQLTKAIRDWFGKQTTSAAASAPGN
jgi:hypothetical protein